MCGVATLADLAQAAGLAERFELGTLLTAGQLDAEVALYVVTAALLGTRILQKISDPSFRRWTGLIVLWTGGFYLCKALVLIVP